MTVQPPVLLITRPNPEAGELADRVREECSVGFEVVISPLFVIEPVLASVRLRSFEAVIFTSVNGVRNSQAMDHPSGQTAFCVGDRTAEAARDAGFTAVSAQGAAPELIQLILSHPTTGPMVHLRGADARGDIAENLCNAGRDVQSVVVYRQSPLSLSQQALDVIGSERSAIVPIYSPKAAMALLNQAQFGKNLHAIAMSDAVADLVRDMKPASLRIAERPDQPAMVAAICAALGGNSGLSGP